MAVYGNVENLDAIVLATVMAGARHIDGFSPIVETEQTATGEHITITDKEAVHEFDIRNGSAMAARVEDETAYFVSDGAQYQPVEISDESEYFESDTVEGALDELAEATANIASDVAGLQDALETEQTAIRTVALGGTGADNAEDARENLGLAFDSGANYTKLPDGTFMQWGVSAVNYGTNGTGTKTADISFLEPFVNASISVIAAWADNADSVFDFDPINTPRDFQRATGFRVKTRTSATKSGEWYFSWIAIGRWK